MTFLKWWPWLVVIAVVTVLCLVDFHIVLWFTGMWPVPSGTSIMYQFWSGFYLVMVTLVTSSWLRKQNCHVHWCLRTGRYPVADGIFRVCRHHHPDQLVRHGRIDFEHIVRIHRETRNNPPS